ncbi:MAG: pilus assembly protein N-terminal domain-containing protein, partial [Schwartzia sp.]|nr:pilus assembly protein N-terminal domain-containing protein [Schwartzia sp. (in: firmicutes)]
MNRIKYGAAAFGVMGMAIFSPVASAAETIDIGLNGSFRFEAGAPITNIAIANPEIADIARPTGFDDQVIIVGLKAGSTTLYVWLADGSVEEYMIVVSMDDVGQAIAIQRAIGLPNVIVQVVDDENKRRVLLKGTVRNQKEHEHALKIASLYAGGKVPAPATAGGSGSVSTDGITSDSEFEYDFDYMTMKPYDGVIDLLTIQVPSQIRLEAQIIEIGADDAADLGFKYYRPTGMTQDTSTGFISVEYANNPGEFAFGENIHGSDHRGSWLWRHFSNINAMLQFLITNNKAH